MEISFEKFPSLKIWLEILNDELCINGFLDGHEFHIKQEFLDLLDFKVVENEINILNFSIKMIGKKFVYKFNLGNKLVNGQLTKVVVGNKIVLYGTYQQTKDSEKKLIENSVMVDEEIYNKCLEFFKK